jgi:hypothetical protein
LQGRLHVGPLFLFFWTLVFGLFVWFWICCGGGGVAEKVFSWLISMALNSCLLVWQQCTLCLCILDVHFCYSYGPPILASVFCWLNRSRILEMAARVCVC